MLSSSDNESKSSTSEITVRAGPSAADLEAPPKRKRGKENIFDERLSTSLNFAKLSDRKANVVSTTLKSAATDPPEYNINSSSNLRQCMKQRVAESSKKNLCQIPLLLFIGTEIDRRHSRDTKQWNFSVRTRCTSDRIAQYKSINRYLQSQQCKHLK